METSAMHASTAMKIPMIYIALSIYIYKDTKKL